MALKLGGTAKAIADAKKKREEEERKASESKTTYDGMKAAAANAKNLSDYANWSSQGKKDEEKNGVNMTMAGPTNKALTSSQAATAAQANKATEKPKITYTGQKTKSAQDFINDWNAQKKQKNQYALEDFGKKNTQAQTYQAQKKQAEQLREAGRALDEDAKNPNRPAVRVAKTAQDVARDIASGKVKIGGKAEKKESYKPLTAEEAAARTLDREQREEDVRRGLVGNTKDKASALQTWMNDEENGADVWTLMNDMMGDQRVSAATKQAVMQANELMGVDGMKRAMLDNADSRAYMEQVFERDVWNPAQEREKAYNQKYGNPTETLQTAQERMRAHYNAQIDTDKQSLRQIAQTNPLFAAQQYSGMRDSYQQEIADLEAMRADMERHPEAYAQWEKDMARDRLLAAQNELASLGDIEKEWQPDYQVKSQAVEGVNDPVYKMINGEADAFQDTEAMAKWRMEQAESLGKREKELQEQLNALAPGDPRRELLQGQIDTLRSQTGLMYEESAMPTLDNLIFSEMMDEGDRLTYNYIYRTEGRNAANEYLDRTKTKWYAGYTDKELQELNDWLQESGWNMALGNLASMVTAPAEAISNLVYTMRTAKGELVDAKDPMFLLTRKSNLTRQATGEALANLPDKNFVGIDKGSPAEQWLNNTRRWILTNGYNLLSSGMDQYGTAWLMVVPGIGQALATGALAGKAGTAAIIETLDEGGFSRQASCRGMVTALCEYGTEKIGMERLVDAFSKGQLNAGFAKTLTKSMLSEALEEVPGNLIDRAMDNWYGGENSHRNQEIKARMKQGMSQAQAEAEVDLEFIQQTATEALMAGLSAGISQGVGYVVGNVSAKHQANREQRQTLNDAARIEREYQQKYGAETAEAVRTLAQEETTEEGRVAALTTAANAVLAEKRGPINPEIAEIILNNDHPDGMKTDELNDWRQTFTNVLNDSQRVRQAQEIRRQRNQGRQQRAGERVEAEKAQAAELNEEETRPSQPADAGSSPREGAETEMPTPRTTPEERRAEAEELNEQETVRPAAEETPAQEAPTPRTTPAERRAEAEQLNQEETRTAAATEETAPTPRTTPAERRAEAERLNQEETRTAAATAETEETAPAPRTTPEERRAELERLNQEETRMAAATGTTEETAPTPRTTPAERRAEAEQLNEQETRQEPVTQADVMEAIQEESEEQDRRGVFAAPATVDGGETQVTGIVTTQHDEKNGAQVEVTDAEGNKKTVKLGDVRFGRAWQRGAYDIATSFRDADAARAFLAVAEQESMPLETVKRDFARYYQYGRNRNENMLNVAGKAISDASARAAYEAGARSLQNDRPTEKNGLMAKVRDSVMQLAKDQPWAKVADGQTYSGVSFDASVKPEQMTARQLAHAYVLNETGKKFGVHFSLMNMGQGVAGMYVKGAGTNTVMLNVADVDANLTRAAGHETWHLLNDWAEQNGMADAINGVRDMMFDLMQESGWDVETRIREKQADYKKRAGQDLTEDQAREELMADSLFDLFTREDVLNDLFAKADPEQKTVLQKIADFVKRVIDDMRGMIRQAARVNPEVEAVLNADQEKLNQVYQTVDSFLAARATTEQVKAENQAETQEQYQLKDKTVEKQTQEIIDRNTKSGEAMRAAVDSWNDGKEKTIDEVLNLLGDKITPTIKSVIHNQIEKKKLSGLTKDTLLRMIEKDADTTKEYAENVAKGLSELNKRTVTPVIAEESDPEIMKMTLKEALAKTVAEYNKHVKGGMFVNDDTGVIFTPGKEFAKETWSHNDFSLVKSSELFTILLKTPEAAKKAVYIGHHPDYFASKGNMYLYMSPVEIKNGRTFNVLFEARTDETNIADQRLYIEKVSVLTDTEAPDAASTSWNAEAPIGGNNYVASRPSGATIKVSRLLQDVNTEIIKNYDKNDLKNKVMQFSLTDIEEHDTETERLIRENNDLGEALQAANTLIDIMRKRPDGLPAAPSAASIDRLARKIKDETGTKVSLKNLRENLDKTFTVMLNAERSGDVEMAYEMLGDIAADAVNQADVIYDPATAMGYDGDEVRSWLTSLIQGIHESDWGTLSEIVGTSNANEIRKWIKDKAGVWMRSTAKLGENAETGATEWQGSRDHRERRNAHGGIDGDYETFARNFPGIVDPDVNDTEDMIAQVLDALDRLKPQVVNRYESVDYNEGHPEGVETAKARLTAELFQAYLEDDSFTRAMTGAEATRLSKENRRIIQGMDALKEQLRETEQKVNKAMDKLIGAEKRQARTVEMLKNARKEQERIAQSWREKVADQAHRRAENEEYNKLKNHVVKIKNRLQRMAMDPSNTSRGFIPRELNDVVDRLLRAVDYDGTFIPEGATAPALDAAGRAKMDADLVGQLLEAYQTARTTPENGSYILFDEDLPEVIARLRDSLKTKADGMAAQRGIKGSKDYRLTKAERLTMQEMTDLERIMRGMEAMINNANRALTDAKGRRIEEIGEAALEQVDKYVETHGEKKTGTRITEWMNAGLKNGMMKPVTYFDMMRDTEFNRLFYEGDRSLRNAEGTQVRLMQGAEEKLNELLDKYHMRDSFNRSGAETQKKRREKAVEITLKTGEKLRITDQEAMSIYATYKREKDGVTNHLLTGGIMLADRDRRTTNKPMVLFLDDINAIIDTLTDEQKGFVDEAVGYLSTEVAEWGNEITRQLYGVDKFTEKYYFPFEVVKSTVEAKVAEAQDQRIKVGSQTKALTVGANNALNIRGFTEVWCQHVEKMADYNAFVLPIEDMTRLLNYQHIIRNDDGDIIGRGRNIKTEMEAAYVYNKAAKTGEAANRKVNTEIWTALMMTEYKQHGESAMFTRIVNAAQKAGASAGSLMGKFKAEFPKISPLVDKAAQALNRGDFTTYEKAVQEMETRYKLGTKTINAMVNTAFNALQEKPATSTSTKSFAQELHADQGNYATVGENVAKDALAKALASGTEKQIKDAVAQAKKQGRTDSEIKSAVNAAYKQDFIEALAAGNKSKAGQLVKKMVASGAYTEADIASETLNWAKSGSQWGLYDSIRRGDSKQAANIYSWMCQTYGSATMVKSIASWLETNAADNEENVRKCLKAMGYGAGRIETIIKKSNAKKNKTTTKTKKTNKTKTTKAWE